MPTRAIEAANLEVELLPPHILSHRLKRVCRTAYDLEIAMAEVLELRARVKAAETRFAERNRQGAVNALHATPRLFVDDKRAFFAAKGHKADEIAARQLCALRTYQGLREKKLKLTDVKEMFRQMRDEA